MKRILIFVALLFLALGAIGMAQRSVVDGSTKRRPPRRQQPRPAASPTPPVNVFAVNQINENHTFTVKVEEAQGAQAYRPVENAAVTITLTNSNGAVANPAGPFTGVTNADGEFSCTFTSATGGTVMAHGSASFTIPDAPAPLVIETDGIAPNSDDAIKLFIDVKFRIMFIQPPPPARRKTR